MRSTRLFGTLLAGMLLVGMMAFSCKGQDRGQPDVGVTKPLPPSAKSTPPFVLPPVTTSTATAAEAEETTEPADIPPEVASVFDEMDYAFRDSTARSVTLKVYLEMISSVRGFRTITTIDMKLQFPNKMDIRVMETGEVNDRATTGGWTKFEGPVSGLLCDGTTLLLKKGFVIKQAAPASLDALLAEQLEIGAWGDNSLATCFLKTRPSTAFKRNLKRARLLEYDEEKIILELVTVPPLGIRQRNNIPLSFDLVQYLVLNGRTKLPTRCHIDHTALGQEIYRRGELRRDAKMEKGTLDIVVNQVNLKESFAGKGLFVLPAEETRPSTFPLTTATIGTKK